MAKYSLYEAIKDKLSPNTQRRLESQTRYNELIKPHRGHSEDDL